MAQYIVVAILEIGEEQAFREFEARAIAIMRRHGARLLSAFRSTDGKHEIHSLAFPSEKSFHSYRADPELAALGELRQRGVLSTIVHSGFAISY